MPVSRLPSSKQRGSCAPPIFSSAIILDFLMFKVRNGSQERSRDFRSSGRSWLGGKTIRRLLMSFLSLNRDFHPKALGISLIHSSTHHELDFPSNSCLSDGIFLRFVRIIRQNDLNVTFTGKRQEWLRSSSSYLGTYSRYLYVRVVVWKSQVEGAISWGEP